MKKEEELKQESWDVKRITIGVLVLIGLIGGGLYTAKALGLDIGKRKPASTNASQDVQGVSVSNNDQGTSSENNGQGLSVSIPSVSTIKSDLQSKINSLTQQVTHLSPADIASSSPQVQKILNDIKALEQGPVDQVRQICENVCHAF